MPPFDERDLKETAARIRAKLDDDQEAIDLLQQLIDSHDAQAEMWREQLDDIQAGQSAIAKAVVMLAKQHSKTQAQLGDLRKGLASLYRMTKSQTASTGKPLGKSLLSKSQGAAATAAGGLTLQDEVKKGRLASMIVSVFGENGGKSVPYDPARASRLMLQGRMSPKEHQTWKRSNRVSDSVWSAMRQAG